MGTLMLFKVTENLILDSVSLFSVSLTKTLLGVIPATPPVTDPISLTEFTTPIGASVYQLILPIGSVVANGPKLEMEICTTLRSGTALGDIQTVYLTPGYQFGDTPTGVNGPIFDYPAKEVSGNIDPGVELLEKTSIAPEGKRPPGPSFPFEYHLSSNIADGETLTDIIIFGVLDPAIQWTGKPIQIIAANAKGCSVVTTPNMAPISGGDLKVHCGSVTGSTADVDLQVVVEVYITGILDESAVNPQQTIPNHVEMIYAYDNTVYGDVGDVDVLAKPYTLQKQGSPRNVLLGENVSFTLDFQYTDYPLTGNKTIKLGITDILPDGLNYNHDSAKITLNGVDKGVVNPVITDNTPNPVQKTLFWDLLTSQQLATGSVGSITFTAEVANVYHDGADVLAGDNLLNTASASWELESGGTGTDSSSDTVSIFNAVLSN
ncbi:hypothetical protein BJAS_P3111 [Bathymodiolus japonicus methanotrophic gill symbiont]|uniref:hypothetical protein n=1 Tax=Bathymodiolus japonicus methanotrophic gill symbiont TaxID=113269 RepID=UPI001B6C1984|nr:hypothetical protein [Bathymodiolus japonicus methanotrophic gill symbiont]GFO72670.1 hypothetical protein BJAS_P3111 [Bathymodiolus japonicus methanotrophic gill symbiont]